MTGERSIKGRQDTRCNAESGRLHKNVVDKNKVTADPGRFKNGWRGNIWDAEELDRITNINESRAL